MIYICINTCAMMQDASEHRGSYDNNTKHPYSHRVDKLRTSLKAYASDLPDVQLIVVGEWEPTKDGSYLYLHDIGKTHTPEDQAQHRWTGTPDYASDDDYILYLNDDHFLLPEDLSQLIYWMVLHDIDVAALKRLEYHADSNNIKRLEDGWPGYIHGHGHCSTIRAARAAKWCDVDPQLGINADLQYTALVRANGLTCQQAPISLYDVETGDHPYA